MKHKTNSCDTCGVAILKTSQHCQKHVPRTKEWREKISNKIKGLKRELRTGEDAPGWKGGKTNCNGYVYVCAYNHPNKNASGYVAEHRLVLEEKIGRLLEKWETVHHKNGIRTDNRAENLEILSLSDHMKEHAKTKTRDEKGVFT